MEFEFELNMSIKKNMHLYFGNYQDTEIKLTSNRLLYFQAIAIQI